LKVFKRKETKKSKKKTKVKYILNRNQSLDGKMNLETMKMDLMLRDEESRVN